MNTVGAVRGKIIRRDRETGEIVEETYAGGFPSSRFDAKAWEGCGFEIVPCTGGGELRPVWWNALREWFGPEWWGRWDLFRSDEEGKATTAHDYLAAHDQAYPGIELSGSGFGAVLSTDRLPPLLDGLNLGNPIEMRLDLDKRNGSALWGALRSDRPLPEVLHWSCRIYRLPEGASLKSRELAPGLLWTVDDVIPLPGAVGPFSTTLDLRSSAPWYRPVIDHGGATTFDRASRTYFQTEPTVGPMFIESDEVELPEALVELIKGKAKK
jgi:hypothetical protein